MRVVGEASEFTVAGSGHVYWTLKDGGGFIKCMCYRETAAALTTRLPLPDGTALEVTGRVTTYIPRGNYQIVVDDVVPVGRGALYQRFEQLKERLRREGLFEPARKREIPTYVKRVAIVTSRDGAALHDFVTTCKRRGAHVAIDLVHAPVQGEAAAPGLALSIKRAGMLDVDVVVIARGGGSIEDLWAFNTEKVARAIAECRRPVISAVGHETDFTIADFVADLRVATPTAAAERVTPDRTQLLRQLADGQRRLARSLTRILEEARRRRNAASSGITAAIETIVATRAQTLDDAEAILRGLDPRRRIVDLRRRIAAAAPRLRGALTRAFASANDRVRDVDERMRHACAKIVLERTNTLGIAEARLAALGPPQTLRRGYAIVFAKSGKVLVDSARAKAGDPLNIQLHRGRVSASVTATEEAHGQDDGE